MKILKQLGLAVATLVLTLILAEGTIRILSLRFLIYNIEMVKYAKDLKVRHSNPEISHRHKKNAASKLMGVEIKTNSMGFRNREILGQKDPKTYRSLVLGSSITMGWGVPRRKVFTNLVEERLRREKKFSGFSNYEMVNAGIGNYNLKQQSILFHEQYPKLKPDSVVLHYFLNDVEPGRTKRNNPIFEYSFLATYLKDWVDGLTYKLDSKKSLRSHYADLYSDGNENWTQAKETLKRMKATLDKKNTPFLVMIIPDFHRLEKGSPYAPLYSKIEDSLNKLGIQNINLFPPFQERFAGREEEVWIQPDDPHPNALGHQLMAEILFHEMSRLAPGSRTSSPKLG